MKRMRFIAAWSIIMLLAGLDAVLAVASTPHFLPLQGYAIDDQGTPLPSGDLAVRVYDEAIGGTLLYDSGSDFAGAVVDGVVDLTLGAVTVLTLDGTVLSYMEIDLAGIEMVGDAAGGRYAFYPGGSDHSRQDLEDRVVVLEAMMPPAKVRLHEDGSTRGAPAFGGTGATNRLEAGVLGLGLVRGAGTTNSAVAGMLLQPVGTFSADALVLKLGPFHIPVPQQVSAVHPPALPDRTRFRSCEPNPFNPQTTLHYDLAKNAAVRITVHDVAGRLVRRLRTGAIETAGRHQVVWRGSDDNGRQMASGVYLVRFRAGAVAQTLAITLLK